MDDCRQETPFVVLSKAKSDCLKTAGGKTLLVISPEDIDPPDARLAQSKSGPITWLLFWILTSLLLSNGKSSVSVSKSANERSSRVFADMLGLLLAAQIVVHIGSFVVRPVLLILLLNVTNSLFSNFTID